jgi:RNA polymerase sigma factor (sigma-70 family)
VFPADTLEDDTDAILMAAVAAGSEEAMSEIYDRLVPGIHTVAVRVVGLASADDVVQDTFERLWRNAARFDARRGTLGAWANRIAHNVAVGHLRRVRPPLAFATFDQPDLESGPADAVERREAQVAVRSAIAQLPAERRAVVEHVLAGCTLLQVAHRLGVPEGTAKSRARAAYADLRVALAAYGSV